MLLKMESLHAGSSEDEGIFVKRKLVRKKLIDSDDDIEANNTEPIKERLVDSDDDIEESKKKSLSQEFLNSVDHGEDGERSTFSPLIDSDDDVSKRKSSRLKLVESDDDDVEGSESIVEHRPISPIQKHYDYDAEGSEDETITKPTKLKRRSQSERMSKSKAVQQIHSETQRLVRESRVSLPYHKPRQRSLAEFLQRRRTSAANTTSLKMSADYLGQVWQYLRLREEEAEEFYKSESDESVKSEININNSGTITSRNEANISNTDVKFCGDETNISGTNTCSNEVAVASNGTNISNNTIPCTDQTAFSSSETSICNSAINMPNIFLSSVSDTSISCSVTSKPNKTVFHSGDNIPTSDTNLPIHEIKLYTCDVSPLEDAALLSKGTEVCNTESNDSVDSSMLSRTTEDKFHDDANISNILATTGMEVCSSNVSNNSNNDSSTLKCETKLCNNDTCILSGDTSEKAHETGIGNGKTNACSSGTSVNIDTSDHRACNGSAIKLNVEVNKCNNETSVSLNNINTAKLGTECKHSGNSSEVSVTNDVNTISSPNLYVDKESEQTQLVEDSCDFHLHYTESQSMDVKGELTPSTLSHSALHEDESNAVDACGEEKTSWWQNLRPPSPLSDDDDEMLQRLKKKSLPGVGDIMKITPRLRGTPNEVINLDEETTSKGVVKLVERFMKHSAKKQLAKKKHPVEIGVVTAEKGENGTEVVQKDVVTVTLGEEDETECDSSLMAKPGAKLQRLKQELQQQMAQRRADEWMKRQQGTEDEEEAVAEELSDCGGLKDEPEEEMTETETESEEEEEDDLAYVEKRRSKNTFVDDEADVSDDVELSDDDDDDDEESNEGKVNRTLHITPDVETTEEEVIKSMQQQNVERLANTVKQNKGIDLAYEKKTQLGETMSDTLEVAKKYKSMFRDIEKDKTVANTLKSPLEENNPTNMCNDDDDLRQEEITSDTEKVAENMNNTENVNGAIFVKDEKRQATSATTVDVPRRSKLERCMTFDLFASQDDGVVSQESGAVDFMNETTSEQTKPEMAALPIMTRKLFTEPEPLNTQENVDELMGLCSGKFSESMDSLVDPVMETNSTNLEDELMGLCSGKFSSQPVNMKSLEQDDDPLLKSLNLGSVMSSSDEENDEVLKTKTRRNFKQLDFSDESGSETDPVESENEDDSKSVDYDSEENEVTVPPDKKMTAEFFDEEAELSESEWDSADEDEQGLDTLEWEEGDDEKLDQRKVKEQLDKIHMRRLLDEDRREVRLLQEMLLEDGELHSEGGGRERKFRWKNINNIDDSDILHQNSDNEIVEDADNDDEEQWRRMRHEREMFLQQQKLKANTDEDSVFIEETDSQLLRLGQAALKRMNSQDQVEQPPSVKQTSTDPLVSPDPKRPFNKLLTKRGSFLARKESVLAKIAKITQSATDSTVMGPKNSRNFVFASLSPEKTEEKSTTVTAQVTKRKQAPEVTPPIVKKLRLTDEHSRGRRLLDLLF